MDNDLNLIGKISSVGNYEIYTVNKTINVSKEVSSVGNFKICTIKNTEKKLDAPIKYKISSHESNNFLSFKKM